MKTLKKLVIGKKVKFNFYRKGNLWYEVVGENFQFPVPIESTGDGSFLADDSASFFMSYIKEHLKTYNEAVA